LLTVCSTVVLSQAFSPQITGSGVGGFLSRLKHVPLLGLQAGTTV
jgi:hypothetical protein